ncbi:hypothetical protein T07_5939 [Trichinella nelsoni]|uniref:Uncharacterized protein n=1 Tax=Trichinella nelsoni TaxID=6336 RepID=A0A0V0SH34_9BILA|nr:hypothetical protein T07_5939 [Trichinella nelsoni]
MNHFRVAAVTQRLQEPARQIEGLEVIRLQQPRTTSSSDKPPQRSQKAVHCHLWNQFQMDGPHDHARKNAYVRFQ